MIALTPPVRAVTRLRRFPSAASVGVSLALTLAACSEGCSRELPVTEPEFARQRMSIEQLEDLLILPGPGRWLALPEHQLFALERLLPLLIEQAEHGQLRAGQARRVAKLASAAGLQLHDVELELDGGLERLWVLVEPLDDRRGRGSYAIRVGAFAEPAATELLLQAPHNGHDKYTGTIALHLFAEQGQATRMRALFVNSVHRYAREDGSHQKHETAALNFADAAHNPDHPIARATGRALVQRTLSIVQLHGFDRQAGAGDPDMIISAGTSRPNALATLVVTRLRAAMPEFSVALYGVDSDRLGAESNVQGASARASSRCFVHIEASERVRLQLRDDATVRRRFADAVMGANVVESAGDCR